MLFETRNPQFNLKVILRSNCLIKSLIVGIRSTFAVALNLTPFLKALKGIPPVSLPQCDDNFHQCKQVLAFYNNPIH